MDNSKFDSFMNDVMAHKDTVKKGYDLALGDKKEEVLALCIEHKINRRIIFDSLIKAGIINKDSSYRGFSAWMTKSIKRSSEANLDISDKQPKVYRVEDS